MSIANFQKDLVANMLNGPNKNSRYKQGMFKPINPKKYNGNPCEIVYRSSFELKVMVWLDRNPDILEWSSEETVIPYISPLDGKAHRYFPDFLIKIKTATGIEKHLIEVKPEAQIQKPKPPKGKKVTKNYIQAAQTYVINQSKWESARKYCKQMGYKFTLLNEFDIGINK